jgi:hypothetical protein
MSCKWQPVLTGFLKGKKIERLRLFTTALLEEGRERERG